MKKAALFFMSALMALSLYACQNQAAEEGLSESSQEASSRMDIQKAPESSLNEEDEKENKEEESSSLENYEEELSDSSNQFIVPAAYSKEARKKDEEFPVSKYLAVKPEDVESFSVLVPENGSEKELILKGDDAKKAAEYLLNFPIYHNDYSSGANKNMGNVLFLLKSKEGKIDTFFDDGFITINEQDYYSFTKLQDFKLPLPKGAKFKSYKLDLSTGERKKAYNFDDPLVKYLVENIEPSYYDSIYMDGKNVCILADDENIERIKPIVADYGPLGDRMVFYTNYKGDLKEYYSTRKHLEAKIEALGLKDKLRVILKRGNVEVLGNSDDDLTAFFEWIKNYDGRNSVCVKLSREG